MSEEQTLTNCLRCGDLTEETVEYCSKCERKLNIAKVEVESFRSIKRHIAGYLISVLLFFGFLFAVVTGNVLNENANLGLEDITGYFFLFGYAGFTAMFARPFVLNFLGRSRDGSITGQSGTEIANWFALKTDYVKLISSGVSAISFAIALFISVSEYGLHFFAVVSFGFMLASLGVFVMNLTTYIQTD